MCSQPLIWYKQFLMYTSHHCYNRNHGLWHGAPTQPETIVVLNKVGQFHHIISCKVSKPKWANQSDLLLWEKCGNMTSKVCVYNAVTYSWADHTTLHLLICYVWSLHNAKLPKIVTLLEVTSTHHLFPSICLISFPCFRYHICPIVWWIWLNAGHENSYHILLVNSHASDSCHTRIVAT